MQYGKRVAGMYSPKTISTLATTKPGEIYEFHVETESAFENEEAIINQLLLLESEVKDLKITSIETVGNNKIILQFKDAGPGAISLWGVWDVIPTLLIVVGLVVALIVVWQIWTTQPWLLLLGAGASVALFVLLGTKPLVERLPVGLRTPVRIPREPSRVPSPAQITRIVQAEPREALTPKEELTRSIEKRKRLENLRRTIKDQMTGVDRNLKGLNAKLKTPMLPSSEKIQVETRINVLETKKRELEKSTSEIEKGLKELKF